MSFSNHRDYHNFATSIRNNSRFALDEKPKNFLASIQNGIKNREFDLSKGHIFYRAARDYDEQIDEKNGTYNLWGCASERMYPNQKYAGDGRVNPRGIPVLYLALNIDVAVAEIRPWIGETISVAQFKTNRELKLVDLSKGYRKLSIGQLSIDQMMGNKPISQETIDNCVWIDIDNAFSRPMTISDNGAEYAPTQIIAELIRQNGYDGVVYKSSFGGEKGYNIALFDTKDADIINCAPYDIESISITHKETGNRWFKKQS